MKFITEFRHSALAGGLISRIRSLSKTPVRFMEFCGGHTVTIFRYGIRQVLPSNITMLSGPGCPVCVTANIEIDRAVAMSRLPDVIITTFGDMLKVPGSHSSLQKEKAAGADVRIVYSTVDALAIAEANPGKSVIFLGIGFETTAPTIAASILSADEKRIPNYYVLPMNKLCPPVIKTLLDAGEVNISGLICPGHVSTVIGSHPWGFIARDYGIPCVISGFEPLDILQAVYMLVSQVESGDARVEIAYRRGVVARGNEQALKVVDEVFEPCPADWRGMGSVENSGLRLRKKYQHRDAGLLFPVDPGPSFEPAGCICGDILRAVKGPADCKLFGVVCTPEHPVGPCMVSSEGSCSAHYLYGGAFGG